MGQLIDRLFRRDYFRDVCTDYALAIDEYKLGLAEFESRHCSDHPLDEYEYKKYIHDHISEIQAYDATITAANSIELKYPKGAREFRNKHNIASSDNSYEVKERISRSKKEIKEMAATLIAFSKIKQKHSMAVVLLVGDEPTFKKIESIVGDAKEVEKLSGYITKYEVLKDKYPMAMDAFMGASLNLDNLVRLNESIDQHLIEVVNDYIKVKRTYTYEAFRQLLGTLSPPEENDYSDEGIAIMKNIIRLHKIKLKEKEDERKFKSLSKRVEKPLILTFGKNVREFSNTDKKKALTLESYLNDVQSNYFNQDQKYFWTPQYGNYLDMLLLKATNGKKYTMPDNNGDIISISDYYRKIHDLPEGAIGFLCPNAPACDDISEPAISYRKDMLYYLNSSYGKAHNSYDSSLALSRDEFIRELFDFPGYGSEVRFSDEVSINKCYLIEESIEACNKSFPEVFAYAKKHEASIKAFNQLKSGSLVRYVDDYISIAKEDKELFAFIEEREKEEGIRDSVRRIINSYKMGFGEYERMELAAFNIDSASVTLLKSIVDNAARIQELDTIARAKKMLSQYPDAIRDEFGLLSPYSLSYDTANRICRSECTLRSIQGKYNEKKSFLQRIENATRQWHNVAGIPFYFFYWYYPTRFSNITGESQQARRLVYNFKDGADFETVADMVKSKLRSTFASSDISSFTLVCIPASTIRVNESRYRAFSEELCAALGMRDAFSHIHITREKTASHLGGTDSAEYSFDSSFFKDSKVVLFDDIVTRGGSMRRFKAALESFGATVVCALSIGRTYSDWNGRQPEPHPWTGNL